ncbi:MAG: HAMP domain-containing sensor histidine kinase [Bacteroidota bacterium]
MNKKAIWIIIGLMGAALVGSVLLQMYWIRWSIQLNEGQFEKNVFTALNRVSEKLEYLEDLQENLEALHYVQTYPEVTITQEFYQSRQEDKMEVGMRLSVNSGLDVDSLMKQGYLASLNRKNDKDGEECDCAQCRLERLEKFEKQERYRERLQFNKMFNPPPITKRIDLNYLNSFVQQEFANRGIYINYNYGVYANKDKSFVITNGHYVVSDSDAGWKNLLDSEYRVDLFPDDMHPPGMLVIHFPTKASLVWGSVWKTLLASILFTGIILFCFAYTIQVIFRQKKLSEMKTDFINNMTHEFKTPIATISLAADSITSPRILGHAQKVERFAKIIKQENKRMNSQVEKVLQMAVIDKREFNLKLTNINLHELINQAVGHISLQVEKKGGTVVADLEATNPNVEGDLTHVSNMIHNLLDNANKYSPDQPEISIHTRNVANGIEVIVKDKGIGMSKEARKHIFDKFYRVHTGNLHDVKGFGLGLSYVKAMMTAHKGQIDVKSELGKGSSFILVFPFSVSNS